MYHPTQREKIKMQIELIENKNTHRRVVPYDTGKVRIGELYTPPPPKMDEFDEQIQAALLGIHRWENTQLRETLVYCLWVVVVLAFLLMWTAVKGGMLNG